MMKIFYYLLILNILFTLAYTQNNDTFSIWNRIMQLNLLSPTTQLQKCFTNNQAILLSELLTNITTKAMNSTLLGITTLPDYVQTIFQQNFSLETRQCIKISNDFNLILKHFSIDISNVSQKFVKYSLNHFSQMHQIFIKLDLLLKNKSYQIYGDLINSIAHTIFGNLQVDQWILRVQNVQKLNQYFGVTVSNGVLGAISSRNPFQLAQTVISGAYDKIGRGRVDNIVQTFPAFKLGVQFGANNYYNFVQQLHLKQGSMAFSLSTDTCSINYQYYALKTLPFGFYVSISINAHVGGSLQIKNVHQAPLYMNSIQKGYQNIDASKMIYSILTSQGTTKSGKMDIAMASSFLLDDSVKGYTKIHQDWDSNLHLEKLKINLIKGQTFKIGLISSLITSQHHSDPLNEAIRIVIRAISMGQNALLKAHTSQWSSLWENDIIIKGNDEDQMNTRLMLYHFYSFLNPWRSDGLSPMGLSGLGYNGHVFWDMDLWMYPAILALKPDFGRMLANYRINRLNTAKNNAFINGYRGSMYPWQSSKSGQEQTPVWALSGPLEHHISGCVSFAIWNYYRVTQDLDWLKQQGYQTIKSVAEFWESRVQYESDGYYHIRNVVAADEWAQNVDDDAFTNAIAIKSLQIVNQANQLLGYPMNKLWKEISQKIIILKFNDTNVTKQHQTYKGQNIKQADVNLLAYPLDIVIDKNRILKDLEYYQTRIPDAGTPAMTFSIFTILYSRLGNADKAYQYFKQSHQQFLRKPFNVFSQTKGGTNPYFLTGAGGVLQSLIFGFGGYDITDKGIKIIETAKPKQWQSITIKGFYKEKNKQNKENIKKIQNIKVD